MSSAIHTHFHPDERPFIDKATEWIAKAEQHDMKRTDFLDPRQIYILNILLRQSTDVHIRFDGGYEHAERKRALLAPDYRQLDTEDIGIQLLSVTSEDIHIASLDHGDYLGGILGLGIKREKIGDIHVSASGCHCLVASEMIPFVHLQLQQIHRVHVQTMILPLNKLTIVQAALEEMFLSVASLRLDGIVSDVIRLSRAKTLIPIKAGKCRVNWKVEEDPSSLVKSGDVISLQGFGRFKVIDIEGVTKKGRYRVKVGKFV